MSRPTDRERFGRVGAWITLGLVAALIVRVVAIDNLVALFVLAPAAAGGVVMLAWPRGRIAALAAVGLVSITAVLGLIGWWGLLFVPSIVLLIVSGLHRDPAGSAG